MKNPYPNFRKIAFIEGISFLVLLFVAMPLKYWGGMPKAVTVVGSVHGALFVALAVIAYIVKEQYNKSFAWGFKVFIASIIPFGTFYMEKEWKREEAEALRQEPGARSL